MSGFEATDEQEGVGFNPFSLIEPDEIPYPTTDVGALNEAAAAIRSGGQELASISEDMESTWQGLQEHYTAPESETLFAAVGPVVTLGEGLESDLSTVATALEGLAEAASEAQRKLGDLRTEAESFAGGLEDRKFWWLTKDEENDDLAITTNLALKMRVNKAWADFTSAEVDCANTIANTCDGTTFANPGDNTEADMVYGANADIFAEGTSFAELDAATLAMMNELTGWAGEKFDSIEFENSMGQAAWDTLMVGVVFGTVQGAVTKSGYWHPERGWASPWDIPTRLENMKDTWTEAGMDAAALVGIHKEGDGWLLQPSSDDPYANLSWDWWWGNVEASAAQVRENHTAWSQRESDPLYSGTYSAINTAMLFTGPFKLGAEVLKFGGGEFSGAEGGSGTGGEGRAVPGPARAEERRWGPGRRGPAAGSATPSPKRVSPSTSDSTEWSSRYRRSLPSHRGLRAGNRLPVPARGRGRASRGTRNRALPNSNLRSGRSRGPRRNSLRELLARTPHLGFPDRTPTLRPHRPEAARAARTVRRAAPLPRENARILRGEASPRDAPGPRDSATEKTRHLRRSPDEMATCQGTAAGPRHRTATHAATRRSRAGPGTRKVPPGHLPSHRAKRQGRRPPPRRVAVVVMSLPVSDPSLAEVMTTQPTMPGGVTLEKTHSVPGSRMELLPLIRSGRLTLKFLRPRRGSRPRYRPTTRAVTYWSR